jgi:hypothetical protein
LKYLQGHCERKRDKKGTKEKRRKYFAVTCC